MKLVQGVDSSFRPVTFVVPENLHPARRSWMMDRVCERGEIYGLPVGPVRKTDGTLTGDIGVEVPEGASVAEMVQLGSMLDYFASALTDYRN